MFAANSDALVLVVKFGGIILGLLLLVWLIAVLTPKAAKLIDKMLGTPPNPRPERVQDNIKPEEYEVHSFFEDVPLQKQEDKKQEARDVDE